MQMMEEMKKKVLNAENLNDVAGGSSKEIISDGQCIRAMFKLKKILRRT